MKILVLNSGSSSLKYQLFEMENESVLAKGIVERIGIEGSNITQTVDGKKTKKEDAIENHEKAIKLVFDFITDKDLGVIENINEIEAIGHRVVHGGEAFVDSTIVDEKVKESIKDCFMFSPLHNPANLMGIEACEKLLPGKPNVAVFDTAFHQTMDKSIYLYPIPYRYYRDYKIRKFGFHGTSHKFISQRTAELMNKKVEDLNIITLHLGNGSSVTAIKNGKSVITSMGLTPLEGLIMGTRSGDIDPAIISFMLQEEHLTIEQVNHILNKESGVLGISEISSDFRDLEDAAAEGNEKAQLALDMFHSRIKRFIGAYMVHLGKIDAIAFAGGIGENGVISRKAILEGLEHFGIILDDTRNHTRKESLISSDDSEVQIFVVPTNEELMIARDTINLIK